MERSLFDVITRSVVITSLVLFIVSFWIEKIAALVLLFAAVGGMAEVLVLSFKYSKLFDAKLLYFILLLLFAGRWFLVLGCSHIAGYFYLAVVLFGAILIMRGMFYLNKYCGPDAESKLDEP